MQPLHSLLKSCQCDMSNSNLHLKNWILKMLSLCSWDMVNTTLFKTRQLSDQGHFQLATSTKMACKRFEELKMEKVESSFSILGFYNYYKVKPQLKMALFSKHLKTLRTPILLHQF